MFFRPGILVHQPQPPGVIPHTLLVVGARYREVLEERGEQLPDHLVSQFFWARVHSQDDVIFGHLQHCRAVRRHKYCDSPRRRLVEPQCSIFFEEGFGDALRVFFAFFQVIEAKHPETTCQLQLGKVLALWQMPVSVWNDGMKVERAKMAS
ncbi:hypothetical protein D3C80_1583680 [compost metagenome]